MAIDPGTMMLIMAAAGAAEGAGGSIAAAGKSKRDHQLAREQMAAQREAQLRNTALAETGLNPFRHQLQQGNAISGLDQLERGSYKPVQLALPANRYAKHIPSLGGGYSYEKSPELIQSAGALKRNVMAGHTAPSMTDPANYGRTGAIDLVRMAAHGTDPSTMAGSSGRSTSTAGYFDGIDRRMAGKIGAAETRGTDVSVADAAMVLERAFRAELGRAPQPGEIEQLLAAQGLKPGDRWVGNAGLMSLLAHIRQQGGGGMQPSYAA